MLILVSVKIIINMKLTSLLTLVITLLSGLNLAFAQTSLVNTNKQIVLNFYNGLFGDKDSTVIDKYVVEDYIQHNPNVADGKEAFKQAARKWNIYHTPKKKIDVVKVIADENYVVLHIREPWQDKVFSLVEIFRLENGLIKEHWDIRQQVPATAQNNHPMF